jgi:hypothetical protein
MRPIVSFQFKALILGVCVAALSGSPSVGALETVSGQARGVQATTFDATGAVTTILADTGTLSGATDARDASGGSGAVGSLLTSGVLHSASIAAADRVSSEASVADLSISIAGLTIGADFVMSRASATDTGQGSALVDIAGLAINGVPVDVTGRANQTLELSNGRLVINEQQTSGSRSSVSALHLVIDGVADVTVASASANAR